MAHGAGEKELDGYSFEVYKLGYSEGQKILNKAKQLLMLKITDEGDFVEGSSPLLASVFMDMDPDDFEAIVNKLAEKSRVKETGGQYLPLSSQKEVVFSGRYELMYKWLDFALEVNYAGFLDELKRTAKKNIAKAEEPNFPKV